ncbi:hypothetical protein PoB_000741500 [Plakobranchus ocellatus]|uniref:Uncharacterized protein n=1 Tax=Plakobranchus ocellatus TaxID=259542 RepID=A0AAV3YDW2_9GAST|nr:hypothetical protein PoB_000741500 [Plakobranchus ocellatus]
MVTSCPINPDLYSPKSSPNSTPITTTGMHWFVLDSVASYFSQELQRAFGCGFEPTTESTLIVDGGKTKLRHSRLAAASASSLCGSRLIVSEVHNAGLCVLADWGFGSSVFSESALRAAGTLLSRVRTPPMAPWPDGGPKSLRSPCCGLAIYTKTNQPASDDCSL